MIAREIKIKDKVIGGNNPILVQSMLKTPLTNTKEVINQVKEMEMAGLDIIRGAVPDMECADSLKKVLREINVPFVADIHFDYKLAIVSVKNGVHKLRINPGNIGGKEKVKEVVRCLKDYQIPVRIGVNAGSLEKDLLEKYHHPTPEALVESAYRSIEYFNEFGYDNIVVSIKSSDVKTTVEANKLFRERYDYPLHLGITEAGAGLSGLVRSSVGIGNMLYNGIGETMRVSLTGKSINEVYAGREILMSLGLLNEGVRIISCPTCGRTKTNIYDIVDKLREETKNMKKQAVVAVMGCAVNGPGEAKEADMGVACGDGNAVFFKHGEKIKGIKAEEIIPTIMQELDKI